jgi:hypothetical protein
MAISFHTCLSKYTYNLHYSAAIRVSMGSNWKLANRVKHQFIIMEFRRNSLVDRRRTFTALASKYLAISRRAT